MNLPRSLLIACLGLGVAAANAAWGAESAPAPAANVIVPRLEAAEVVTINVVGEDDVAITTAISPQGTVNLKYLDEEVTIAGLTIPEAEAAIARAYFEGRIFRRAEVRISVEQRNEKVVSLQGQVVNPGRYPLSANTTMNLVELINRAGGFTDLARGSRVTLKRALPDGTTQIREYDVEGMLNGRIPRSQAPILQADDLVEVPMRLF